MITCPHCNSKNIIKYGRYGDDQIYYCKNCRKRFRDKALKDKMAPACEEFFETQMGLDSYLIYGHRYDSDGEMIGHVWVVVMINGEPKEFEASTLQFKQVSEKYILGYIQEGRYIQGVEQDISTSVKDPEIVEIIKQSLMNT